VTAGQALEVLWPALALTYTTGLLHGFLMSSLGAPRVPAHSTVGALKSRPAEKPGDEYTAGMGGKTGNEPRGVGA